MTIAEHAIIALRWLEIQVSEASDWWALKVNTWSEWWDSLPQWSLPDWRSHHYVTISIAIFVFWPIVVTIVMALTAASTWLFWLFTSVIFGFFQLLYVTYQFFMISADIVGLSMLKTFAVIRAQIRHFTMKSTSRKRSRRREWRRQLDKAETYENFLKVPIEPKLVDSSSEKSTSSAKRRRSSFWVNKETHHSSSEVEESPTKPKSPIRRSLSFGNLESSPLRSFSLTRNKSFERKHDLDAAQEKSSVTELIENELGMTGGMLLTTTARLREARLQACNGGTEEDSASLKYLLSGVVKRNHLTLDDILIENSRSIAESGNYGLTYESRRAIHGFYEEIEKSLDWIAESPAEAPGKSLSASVKASGTNSFDMDEDSIQVGLNDISERITLVRKMKQNMGRTALMLSGGGAQAMYHLGAIRAFLESNLYNDISVISGTSGGSISAAMCAIKKPDELLKDICVKTVSSDYMLNGEMKKHNIRWFPSNMEMGAYWLKHRLLVDSADFKKCCDFYYGDFTFAEAFERTGKHVCITVSASRAQGVQRLLLNHISTPHVTLASAVAASCALPGVMAPTKLLAKDSNGRQEPFEVDGVEWIDGSVQADLPFQRISTLFNVSNFVVSQTNFHVIPLLNKAHHPAKNSFYWRLFQTWEWDIRNRALKLSRLGLFPKIFGQDVSKIFKQKYHGNLTLVPRLTTMQTFGLKALENPTVRDMEGYLKYGQIAAWPYLSVLEDMIRLERALENCLARLTERCKSLTPENESSLYDDVDSIVSSLQNTSSMSHRVRFVGSSREAERLKHKVIGLERENVSLRRELDELRRKLKDSGEPSPERTTKNDNEVLASSSQKRRVSEKEVWSHVRRFRQETVA